VLCWSATAYYIRTVCPLAAVGDGDKYRSTVTCHKTTKVFHWPPSAATCCLPVTHAADFYQCSMTDALSWRQRAHFWHPKQRQFVELSDCWLSAVCTHNSKQRSVIDWDQNEYLPACRIWWSLEGYRFHVAQWKYNGAVCAYTLQNMQRLLG